MAANRKTIKLTDELLRNRLSAYCATNKDHWTFRGNAVRNHGHAYFQYPAMMVPQMVGDLLDAIVKHNEGCKSVFDPFAGSGTALTEAMMRGLDFTGRDINPLAVLLCQAKAIPFFDEALISKLSDIHATAKADRRSSIEVRFPNWRKWFQEEVAHELSKIRRAVEAEASLWARRFFWVALAETVRLTSNSRTSTFKLHIRPKSEIDMRELEPIAIFKRIATRNIEHLRSQKEALTALGFVSRGRYAGKVEVSIGDSALASSPSKHPQLFDILVTSPPYGDNTTTVPYGQHSYLPLQWIALEDISPTIDQTCLDSTHELDRRSLGGSRRGVKECLNELRAQSSSLSKTIDGLKGQAPDRISRVVAFCRDLSRCIAPAMSAVKPDAVLIWILGNRAVGGKQVPLDCILSEFLIASGARHITIINRDIPSKRMPVRNNVSGTMRRESIVVLRKGGG